MTKRICNRAECGVRLQPHWTGACLSSTEFLKHRILLAPFQRRWFFAQFLDKTNSLPTAVVTPKKFVIILSVSLLLPKVGHFYFAGCSSCELFSKIRSKSTDGKWPIVRIWLEIFSQMLYKKHIAEYLRNAHWGNVCSHLVLATCNGWTIREAN